MQELLVVYKKQIIFALIGGILISGAYLASKFPFETQSSQVQIISNPISSGGQLQAEIAGEVNSPGVYKLSLNARIEDLITLGGGLSPEADVEYVEKTINRASLIKDGQKLYIPKVGEENLSAPTTNQQTEVLSASDDEQSLGVININLASQSQLETLWGIGPVIAQKIIEQRPYSDTMELISRSIVKQNVYDRIKNQISVY